MSASQICRLCISDCCELIGRGNNRRYYLCPSCRLIFVPEEDHIPLEKEKERYHLHQNSEESESYREYLSSIADEIEALPLSKPRILDFGAGEEFVLTRLLQERGYDCEAYDPLYDLGSSALTKNFDIIVLCEVIEHLRNLPKELNLIGKLLQPNGYVYVRTQFYPSTNELTTWWYANDLTHINFFSIDTMKVVASFLKSTLMSHDDKQSAVIGPGKF